MPLLNWNPGFSVNDVDLDSHHQQLFRLLNSTYENVMNSKEEVKNILPMIEELSEYTKYHFTLEEQHMREKGFHGFDEHIAKHREFTHSIEKLRSNYHDNNLEVASELIIMLGQWLLGHVLKEDRKYADASVSTG